MSKLPDQLVEQAARVWAVLPFSVRKRVMQAVNPRYLVGVVGLIHDGDGRVLLLEHRFRPPYPWGLPGGFITRGESFEDALRRELREELALEVSIEPGVFDVEIQQNVESVSLTLVARAQSTRAAGWDGSAGPGSDGRAPKDDAPAPISREIVRAAWFGAGYLPDDTYPHHAALVRAFWGRL